MTLAPPSESSETREGHHLPLHPGWRGQLAIRRRLRETRAARARHPRAGGFGGEGRPGGRAAADGAPVPERDSARGVAGRPTFQSPTGLQASIQGSRVREGWQ